MSESFLSTEAFDIRLSRLLNEVGSTLSLSEFITRMSNIYHEIESAEYDAIHTEITKYERSRLKSLIEQITHHSDRSLTILDLGCGTGHVTEVMLELQKDHKLNIKNIVLLDISSEMIDVCKRKFEHSSIRDRIEYITGELDALPQGRKFSLVVTSSVLHHIPNVFRFARQVSALLENGGKWISSHEPNADVCPHIGKCYSTLSKIRSYIKRVVNKVTRLRKSGNIVCKEHILTRAAKRAFELNITPQRHLTREEVRGLIDIHTSNPHGSNFSIGFDGFDIHDLSMAFQNYYLHLLTWFTYDHLSPRNRVGRRTNYLLSKTMPKNGAIFSAVWERRS